MTDARQIICNQVMRFADPADMHVGNWDICTDNILSALAAAGLVVVNEKQFVEVACVLYCLGAADRVNGRPQNAVPASQQAWRELRAMVEDAKDGE